MNDLIDTLLGITPGSHLDALRALRPELRAAGAGSEAAIFDAPSGLSQGERHALAAHVAGLHECAPLAQHHAARAGTLRPALAAHAEMLAFDPHLASREAIAALTAAGLAPREIVMASQLIAYVSYQVRMMDALVLLDPAREPHARRARPPAKGATSTADFGFTAESLEWSAWVPVQDLASASAEQIAVLDESHAKAKTSDYYLLLVQEPEVLRQRSRLFNTIMYGPRGASRAERELAASAESRLNGCPYCLSVHAQRYVQLKGDPALMEHLVRDGVDAPMDARSRAIVDASVALSTTPASCTAAHVAALRGHGMQDAEIIDILASVAMFAWANRLMQTLGEPRRASP